MEATYFFIINGFRTRREKERVKSEELIDSPSAGTQRGCWPQISNRFARFISGYSGADRRETTSGEAGRSRLFGGAAATDQRRYPAPRRRQTYIGRCHVGGA